MIFAGSRNRKRSIADDQYPDRAANSSPGRKRSVAHPRGWERGSPVDAISLGFRWPSWCPPGNRPGRRDEVHLDSSSSTVLLPAGRCLGGRTMSLSEDFTRATKRHRCPVCGKPDWCLIAREGGDQPRAAICARIESDRRWGEAGWLHQFRDLGTRRSRRFSRRISVRRQTQDFGAPGSGCLRSSVPSAFRSVWRASFTLRARVSSALGSDGRAGATRSRCRTGPGGCAESACEPTVEISSRSRGAARAYLFLSALVAGARSSSQREPPTRLRC